MMLLSFADSWAILVDDADGEFVVDFELVWTDIGIVFTEDMLLRRVVGPEVNVFKAMLCELIEIEVSELIMVVVD